MANTVLGLDLGTKYIKYVELEHIGKDRFQLLSYGMAPAPIKGINSEMEIDQQALALTIKKLLQEGHVRTRKVNLALPESNVFTRIIQVPPLSERELSSAIKWEAEQYIPLPLEETQMDFSIVGESKDAQGNKKYDLLLVAAPKTLISRYVKVMEMCGLEAKGIETEIIAASRALLPVVMDKPLTLMVVNIGAMTTDLSIIKAGVISFTRTIPTGGVTFTKILSQDLALPPNQAEEYKITYGIQENQLEGKVARSLKPILSIITEEIKRALIYFQNKFPDETVSIIILSGGSAKLPGIVESLVKDVGLETQIGDPWLRIERDPKKFTKIEEEGVMFTVAVGLAMRAT